MVTNDGATTRLDSRNRCQEDKLFVLLVMPEERQVHLSAHLREGGMEVVLVRDSQSASRILQNNPHVQVVLTEASLPDGCWTTLAAAVPQSYRKPEFVICMRVAEPRMWIEALEAGAYDVLVQPYMKEEVQRIVRAAAARTRRLPQASLRKDIPIRALAS